MAFTLYSMPSSGNSYKVRLLLSLLGLTYTHVTCEYSTDGLAEAKTGGKTPTGKVPVLETDDGLLIPESNAILIYLAEGTPFWPDAQDARALALGWMFFEQNRHETTLAVRAALRTYPERAHLATPDRMEELLNAGQAILRIMDDALDGKDWFVGTHPTAADIALYGYTCTAEEKGGYSLDDCPNVSAWLARIANLPGYIPLDHIPDA